MKPIRTILKWSIPFILSSSVVTAQDTIEERNQKAQQVELFYQMAEKAYSSGDIRAAKEALRSALDINRKHGRSLALLSRMRTGGTESTLVALRKRQFDSVVLPLIDLEKVTLREALRTLSDAVIAQSKDKIIPNFVVQDRNGVFDKTDISLKLRNIPAGEVLNHLLSDTSATAKFEKYSTVIRPRNPGVKKSSTTVDEPTVEP